MKHITQTCRTYEFDIHTHTIASGHGSCATITDMVKAAKARDLKMIGISDHGPGYFRRRPDILFSQSEVCTERTSGYSDALWRRSKHNNRKGNLDLNDDILKGLDYVIASMHYPTIKPGTVEENTEAYINAMKNPYVTVIGHCDDTKFPIDPLNFFPLR